MLCLSKTEGRERERERGDAYTSILFGLWLTPNCTNNNNDERIVKSARVT